jgi:ABC-type lipoprotein export system ATPase subunit
MLSESVHQQGMAGSGKSTLMHRMVVRLGSSSSKVYTVPWSSTLEDLH